MKKTLIHTVNITRQGEKVQLQIRLPRNTKSVQEIRVTSSGIPRKPSPKREVGWLWLRIPEHRDVFFVQIINVQFQDYGKSSFDPIENLSFAAGTAWVDGSKESPFSIAIPGQVTLIEGYYTDELKTDLLGQYTLKIYLTLEV